MLSLLLITGITVCCGQAVTKLAIPANCLDSIPSWMAKNKIPVLAASVIEGGEIKELKIFGKLDNGQSAPLNTFFNVASLTKPITALTVLRLVDMGDWNLDEPLDRYWIDPDIRADLRYKKITTRIVLSHQTGFPNWRSQNPTKKLAFLFDPGTRYGYSGEGFEYLRHTLENKFHRTLQQLADSVLFKPLGMNHTRYGWSDKLDSTLFAEPHDKNGKVIKMAKIKNIVAADWLVTTISDYSKFALAVLNQKALSNRLFTEMATPQVKMQGGPKENMGLGWEVIKPLDNDEYLLMHTGSDDGVKTLVILFPKSKRGIVLFTNGNNGFDVIKQTIKAAFHLKELTP